MTSWPRVMLYMNATTARLAARADGRLALVPDDRSVQRDFTGVARHCKAWCGEVPGWASLGPVGVVDTYWRWRELELPALKPPNAAAWGFRVGHGGSRSYGLLGATFEPHNYPFLRVAVAATTGEGAGCPAPFDEATVGLPHEYVGGVLAGAVRGRHSWSRFRDICMGGGAPGRQQLGGLPAIGRWRHATACTPRGRNDPFGHAAILRRHEPRAARPRLAVAGAVHSAPIRASVDQRLFWADADESRSSNRSRSRRASRPR